MRLTPDHYILHTMKKYTSMDLKLQLSFGVNFMKLNKNGNIDLLSQRGLSEIRCLSAEDRDNRIATLLESPHYLKLEENDFKRALKMLKG